MGCQASTERCKIYNRVYHVLNDGYYPNLQSDTFLPYVEKRELYVILDRKAYVENGRVIPSRNHLIRLKNYSIHGLPHSIKSLEERHAELIDTLNNANWPEKHTEYKIYLGTTCVAVYQSREKFLNLLVLKRHMTLNV